MPSKDTGGGNAPGTYKTKVIKEEPEKPKPKKKKPKKVKPE